MPVRDSTEWRHAILEKKVINHDRGGTFVLCFWDTCEKYGLESYKCVEHLNNMRYPGAVDDTLTYVFCSERHRQYFIHSTVAANRLPPGFRLSII